VLTVAGIQIACGKDKRENLEKALYLAGIAAERGAKVICFPECFGLPWFPAVADPKNFRLAEKVPGETTGPLQEFARKNETVVIAPIYEEDLDGIYYNTAVIIDADGEIHGKYRKNHIPQLDNYQEKFYFKPGDLGFPVFKTKYATIGVQICWDNFFPEGSRILALKGAEIIFAPTATSILASHGKWEKAIAANAIANGLFVFRVNRVGAEEKLSFYGKSFCVDPNGDFMVEPAGAAEGAILADIDLERVKAVREIWTFLRDRRSGIYGELV